MNYQRIYDQIIKRSKTRRLQQYTEKHHIQPKCIGGSNSSDNLAYLTAREHFICHWLLTRMYPENIKLVYAFWRMCNGGSRVQQRYIGSSRAYQEARELVQQASSTLNKGRTLTEEQKRQISTTLKGRPKPAVAAALKGRTRPDQSTRVKGENNPMFGKVGNMLGKKHTNKSLNKIREAKKQIRKCEYCGKEGPINSLIRWHFDNCKHKLPD